MNQKIIAVFLVVCLFGSALSQDSFMQMMLLNKLFGGNQQRPLDAALAQNTNALGGTATQGQGLPISAKAGAAANLNALMQQRRNPMSRMMMPLMMGYDLNDPMALMLMSGGFGM